MRTSAALSAEAERWLAALLEELPPARAARVVAAVTGIERDALYARALALKPDDARSTRVADSRDRTGWSPRDRALAARADSNSRQRQRRMPSVGLLRRRRTLEHVDAQAQDVAGPHRIFPLQIGEARRAERFGTGENVVTARRMRDAAGLPAAGDQALPRAGGRALGIGVEPLRIVGAREVEDLPLR